eukprot:2717556-Rhodomonas_salina.3
MLVPGDRTSQPPALKFGALGAAGPLPPYALATPCPVLTSRVVLSPYALVRHPRYCCSIW